MARRAGMVSRLIDLAELHGSLTLSEAAAHLFGPEPTSDDCRSVSNAVHRAVCDGALERSGRGCFSLPTDAAGNQAVRPSNDERPGADDEEGDPFRNRPRGLTSAEELALANQIAQAANYILERTAELHRARGARERIADVQARLGGLRGDGEYTGPKLKMSKW